MGHIEERGRKRAKKRNLQYALLTTVAMVGIIALAAVPSNLPIALHRLGMLPTGPNNRGSVNRARNRLIKRGFLMRTRDGFLRLTSSGMRTLHIMEARAALANNPRRWDGRWRILIFDIPERRKHLRRSLRASLYTVGFARLQDSVWVYPYDCEDFVALLKADLKIGRELLYLIVDEMESDGVWKERFKLK